MISFIIREISGSGGESLIKFEKTNTYSMFEKNMEVSGGSWLFVTHHTTDFSEPLK